MNVAKIAISEQIERFDEDAFHRECAKLDPAEEQAFSDMGISTDLTSQLI